jgi:hypothetical protein
LSRKFSLLFLEKMFSYILLGRARLMVAVSIPGATIAASASTGSAAPVRMSCMASRSGKSTTSPACW